MWISQANRSVVSVAVEVCATAKSHRVLADEPSRCLIIVSGAIEIEVCFGIEFPPRVTEGIRQGTGRGGLFSERVERIRLSESTSRRAQGGDGAKTVSR